MLLLLKSIVHRPTHVGIARMKQRLACKKGKTASSRNLGAFVSTSGTKIKNMAFRNEVQILLWPLCALGTLCLPDGDCCKPLWSVIYITLDIEVLLDMVSHCVAGKQHCFIGNKIYRKWKIFIKSIFIWKCSTLLHGHLRLISGYLWGSQKNTEAY